MGDKIVLQLNCPPVPCFVSVDSVQVQQALTNLITNGQEAMPNGGRLTVHVQPASVEGNVSVVVSDSGPGIEPQNLSKILDAFYTTKPVGKGTGLGLTIVHSMMSQLGGTVEVNSKVGKGATFSLRFAHATAAQPRVLSPRRLQPRGETVLLLEDEESICKLCQRMLEQQGYTVISAGSAQQALDCWQEQKATINLLVSDVVMTGDTGPVSAARLLLERPELPVLFISGYTPQV